MTKTTTKPTITLKPNDLVLLYPNAMGGPPFARLVDVEFDNAGDPTAYWVRDVNASAHSEPVALSPRQVVQIFSGVL